MNAEEFREAVLRGLSVAGALARFTKTTKDDQAIGIAEHLFRDDELFARVKELLELK